MGGRERGLPGAMIERGKITAAEDGAYTVESYDRPGKEIILNAAEEYSAGEKVYFFSFPDGEGKIIGKI